MIKKIDKLVLGSFIGPFILTLVVVDFILLLVALLRYFDELFGKGISLGVFAQLLSYFSISSSPDAFPLAVLLSSIMTFGNLGEHSELTAIKSSGISLVRSLAPIFFFVIILTGITYYTNTRIVPKINLKTYSLLWDMRTKKPTLNLKEGVFYDGIPGYSIKVKKKITDEHLKDVIIYDHTGENTQSNKKVMIADSGRMYSFMNQRYLAIELFNGTRYEETIKQNYFDMTKGGQFVRDKFETSKMVFDLASFDMGDTDERAFRRSRVVQTRSQLADGLDSMQRDVYTKKERLFSQVSNTFRFHMLSETQAPKEILDGKAYYDSIRNVKRARQNKSIDTAQQTPVIPEKLVAQASGNLGNQEKKAPEKIPQRVRNSPVNKQKHLSENSGLRDQYEQEFQANTPYANYQKFKRYYSLGNETSNNIRMNSAISFGINQSRTMRNLIETRTKVIEEVRSNQRHYILTKNQQVARSFACLVMFLIGAPIGAIIKKGGLGMPLILSIIFFLIYYVINTTGEKLGKQGVVNPAYSFWFSNVILLPFGLFFLKQARNDARLFEPDFYLNIGKKVKGLFSKKE